MTVAAAVSRKDIGKRRSITNFVDVDAITYLGAVLNGIGENSNDGTRSDIDHIVDRPASLRESGEIARQEAEAFLTPYRRGRNTGV